MDATNLVPFNLALNPPPLVQIFLQSHIDINANDGIQTTPTSVVDNTLWTRETGTNFNGITPIVTRDIEGNRENVVVINQTDETTTADRLNAKPIEERLTHSSSAFNTYSTVLRLGPQNRHRQRQTIHSHRNAYQEQMIRRNRNRRQGRRNGIRLIPNELQAQLVANMIVRHHAREVDLNNEAQFTGREEGTMHVIPYRDEAIMSFRNVRDAHLVHILSILQPDDANNNLPRSALSCLQLINTHVNRRIRLTIFRNRVNGFVLRKLAQILGIDRRFAPSHILHDILQSILLRSGIAPENEERHDDRQDTTPVELEAPQIEHIEDIEEHDSEAIICPADSHIQPGEAESRTSHRVEMISERVRRNRAHRASNLIGSSSYHNPLSDSSPLATNNMCPFPTEETFDNHTCSDTVAGASSFDTTNSSTEPAETQIKDRFSRLLISDENEPNEKNGSDKNDSPSPKENKKPWFGHWC